jgi:hypothetical protein
VVPPSGGGELGARSLVTAVAVELQAVERDNHDLAAALMDGRAVLVHVGDGKGEVRGVAVLDQNADPLHVVPDVDPPVRVPHPIRI